MTNHLRAFGLATLALTFPLIASAARTGGGVSPELFKGNYAITGNGLGMCSPEILVDLYHDNDGNWGAEAGNYSFMRINAGPWTDDDGGVRVSQSTYTTSDQRLIQHAHTIDHAEPGASYDQTVEFHLVGLKLYVKSVTRNVLPGGGSPVISTETCSYKRIRCQDSAAGCL